MDGSGSVSFLVLADFWPVVSHNWALISILATITLLIVIPALVIAKYVRISLNLVRVTQPPLAITQLDYTPLDGEETDFCAADGMRLRGAFYHPPPGVERRGMIVFAPEFKATRESCARYCRCLVEAGYDVFSFDFRGQGESAAEDGYTPLQWTSDREVKDMASAIALVEAWLEQQGRPVRLGLFGISRGAGAAILAAAEAPSVKAIVTDGAFSSDCTLEHLMKKWAKIFAKVRFVYENHPPEFWRLLRWCLFFTCRFKLNCRLPSVRKTLMRMTPRPMLFIHGERDSCIPVEQSQLLYALSTQPKYLWIVPDARHNQAVALEPEEYIRRTLHFFDRYLARRDDADNLFNDNRLAELACGALPSAPRTSSGFGYRPAPRGRRPKRQPESVAS